MAKKIRESGENMPIRLAATCFLPAGNPVWRPLQALASVEVCGISEWPAVLTGGQADDLVVWVVLMQDLLSRDQIFSEKPHNQLPAALVSALNALEQRLKSASAATIVAWSSWFADSPLRAAKQLPDWQVIGNLFTDELYRLAANYPSLYLLSLDRLFSEQGFATCFDSRNYQTARCRFSLRGLEIIVNTLVALCERIQRPAAKVLVLDCDNTLWGGVIGESGLSGIQLGQDGIGQAYVEFQKVVRWLQQQGTLLAISSKNEAADVWAVFEQHPMMVLQREDFAAFRIDWRDKVEHLRELAAEINVGLDSLVFWDDNPLERENIRTRLPDVHVPEPPTEVVEWADALARDHHFARFVVTVDDLQKKRQYQARTAFLAEAQRSSNLEQFLSSIAMHPACVDINAATLARAAQLCAKTNQFNLRLVRHDESTLQRLLRQEKATGFLVRLSDRFGDHGIVGLVIAVPTLRADLAFLDTFLLSCRALGRHLEAWMLNQVAQHLKRQKVRYLLAEFIAGERNAAAADFLHNHGFVPVKNRNDVEDLVAALTGLMNEANPDRLWLADLDAMAIPYLEVFCDETCAADTNPA